MKGPLHRTKVVLQHLPPTLCQSMLLEQVDSRFAGSYNWFSFLPGKNSQKRQTYARAYIDFKRPEDVIDFAGFFDGHIFVNAKGTQFKIIVEYAPSQHVPKFWCKKVGREGIILKDPKYLELLEFLAKPVENLPSAEIQLERAEGAGSARDAPIVTPLMDYVCQKRAAKSGARRSVSNGKLTRRVGGTSSGSPSSSASKRGTEKRRVSASTCVLRESSKAGSVKDKTYILVPKHHDQQPAEKSGVSTTGSGTDAIEEETGEITDSWKKKILLLKGKEKEIPNNQHCQASGRIIRSILLKDAHQKQASASQLEQLSQNKDKRPPRPPGVQLFQKDTNGTYEEDHTEKRSRNRDRPDSGVWTPFRCSDSSHASDESSSTSLSSQMQDSIEGSEGETKNDVPNARGGEFRPVGGTYKHIGGRSMRDDGISVGEGNP